MRIKNEYPEKIYWRAFKPSDMVHLVGLHQGSIERGQIGEWREDTIDEIKVEVKTGDIVFSKKWLFHAGQIFQMTDDLVLNQAGHLSVAEVDLDWTEPEKTTFTDVTFIDMLSFNTVLERTVKFSLENSLFARQQMQQTREHEQTWTAGAKVGGTLKKKDVGSASAEISAQFQDKVTKRLTKEYEEQVKSVWSKSVEDKFTFQPGKLYVVAVDWTIEMKKGLARHFGEEADFTALSSASASHIRLRALDSEEQMDPDLRKQYEEFKKLEQVQTVPA